MACYALVETTVCEDAECGGEMLLAVETLFLQSLQSIIS